MPVSAKNAAAAAQVAANENTLIDQDALGLGELAKGVLERDFRPRVASVRRLAEAVLELQEAVDKAAEKKKEDAKKPAKKKTASTKSSKKKGSKKRKLAKIPNQKG